MRIIRLLTSVKLRVVFLNKTTCDVYYYYIIRAFSNFPCFEIR